MLAPAIVAVGVFLLYPIFQTIVFSFFSLQRTQIITPDRFEGLGNYLRVFANPNFYGALWFTLGFTAIAVILDFLVGLGLALSTFYVSRRFRTFLRVVIIIPWAIPSVIQASMWRWILNGDVGVLPQIIAALGITDSPPQFLSVPVLAMISVVLSYVWKGASITAIFLTGGLASVPRELGESAVMDGAGPLTRLIRVTLPVISPTLLVTFLFRTRDALRVFDIVYGLTGGGPGTATETLSSLSYRTYFSFLRFGEGSALAFLTFVLVFAVSMLYIGPALRRFNFR